jgi:hypothetical protein
MDDMKWLYYLILILYGVLGCIKVLNNLIVKDLLSSTDGEVKSFRIFKKDFFTTIGLFTMIMAVSINILCLIGGRPFNLHSVIVSIAVIGMAYLSGRGKVYLIEKDKNFILAGYQIEEGHIKSYQLKNRKYYCLYTIHFKEDFNGYESIKIYVATEHAETLEKAINNGITQQEQED